MPAFKPVPPALSDRFLACLPDDARVERRRMFGCPCAFINGNMFCGLHEDRLVLRLEEQARLDVLQAGQARPFEVMGRTMREYVILPEPMHMAQQEVRDWIARAFAFGASLPVKQAGKKVAKPASGKTATKQTKTKAAAKRG